MHTLGCPERSQIPGRSGRQAPWGPGRQHVVEPPRRSCRSSCSPAMKTAWQAIAARLVTNSPIAPPRLASVLASGRRTQARHRPKPSPWLFRSDRRRCDQSLRSGLGGDDRRRAGCDLPPGTITTIARATGDRRPASARSRLSRAGASTAPLRTVGRSVGAQRPHAYSTTGRMAAWKAAATCPPCSSHAIDNPSGNVARHRPRRCSAGREGSGSTTRGQPAAASGATCGSFDRRVDHHRQRANAPTNSRTNHATTTSLPQTRPATPVGDLAGGR
jgi:hypothetical protein